MEGNRLLEAAKAKGVSIEYAPNAEIDTLTEFAICYRDFIWAWFWWDKETDYCMLRYTYNAKSGKKRNIHAIRNEEAVFKTIFLKKSKIELKVIIEFPVSKKLVIEAVKYLYSSNKKISRANIIKEHIYNRGWSAVDPESWSEKFDIDEEIIRSYLITILPKFGFDYAVNSEEHSLSRGGLMSE